tara:strand:- start:706 stop:981 length:276 start_codon:yes stop_codon:yes gene_type:complete
MSEGKRVRKHNPEHDMAQDAAKHSGHVMSANEGQTRAEVFESAVRDCANFGIYYANPGGELTDVDNQRVDRLSDLRDRLTSRIDSLQDGRS